MLDPLQHSPAPRRTERECKTSQLGTREGLFIEHIKQLGQPCLLIVIREQPTRIGEPEIPHTDAKVRQLLVLQCGHLFDGAEVTEGTISDERVPHLLQEDGPEAPANDRAMRDVTDQELIGELLLGERALDLGRIPSHLPLVGRACNAVGSNRKVTPPSNDILRSNEGARSSGSQVEGEL
eukprot:Mycagemm_TRINITY_DN10107_c0_g1::TRINITY_DN10107_c0_g1_i1::g.5086::m.5086 type:complete len:180 gc:universal TRINITY_DN10107_c0_g1_i1:567-28(-)